MSISGNMVGSYSQIGKTFILVDEDGNEIAGVVVDQDTVFTAGDNDVREGMVYAGDDGVSIGTKNIPAYHTYEGAKVIPAGNTLSLINLDSHIDIYDYTKMQAIICGFNSTMANSVSAQKIAIADNVYNVQSVDVISIIVKNHDTKTIEFGLINDTGLPLIIRYFMYKEIE